MGDMDFQLAIYYCQARPLVDKLGCIQTSCWSRGFHQNPQTTNTTAKTEVFSLQTDNRAPLPRTITTQLIENGELMLVPIWSLYSCVFGALPMTYNLSSLQNMLGQWLHRTYRSS